MSPCVPWFPKSPLLTWLVALLTVGLGSCACPVLDRQLPLEDSPPFSSGGEEEMPGRWWFAFDDPGLNAQMDLALDDSFTLDAARARVVESRTIALRQASDLLLDLDGVVDAGGNLRSGPNASSFGFGLEAGYEPDLWGRIRSTVEAAHLRADATYADYQTASLFLSAEIANTWFTLIEAHAQFDLVQEQLETNEKGLTLLETRFAGGEPNSSADVIRQRQLVESTREQAVVVQLRIEQLEHQLAILQGRPPQTATYEIEADLPVLPPLPATGVPAELLLRRPDVRREFLALMAADRDIATAVSEQFPRINLTASLSTAASGSENLFRDWVASIAGQLVAPILDGGQRRSEVHRTVSVVNQRVAEYGETVLFAYREVEDALAREKYARERLVLIESQIDLADKSTILLGEQYITGVTDYLAVLTANTEQQRLQRAFLSTKLELVLARIQLYRALSGDVPSRPPPTGTPAPRAVSEE